MDRSRSNHPRMNRNDLVTMTVSGQVAHPVSASNPYRIGHDGVPRVLPGTGGVVTSHRIGDRCVGLAGDHIEPGVSLHNNKSEIVGKKNGPNLALLTYACIGNKAKVLTGPAKGKQGLVTGKHGGVAHLLLDFPKGVLENLRIGDQIQIQSRGLGLQLIDHPEVHLFSCSPALIHRWNISSHQDHLRVPVTHFVPAAIMGSGIGRNNAVRGDYDIQLFDGRIRKKYRLGNLRFGDIVAILDSDTRYGRGYRGGTITIGVVVHGDSTVSGHGPGIMTLVSGAGQDIRPHISRNANIAVIFGIRPVLDQKSYRTLVRSRVPVKVARSVKAH